MIIIMNKQEEVPGKLQVAQLMQLAMERCADARCAIKFMGRLSEIYGFTSEEASMGGASEALTIGDGKEVSSSSSSAFQLYSCSS